MNMVTGKKVKLPRLVRMHSSEMEDVDSAGAGDVVAVFGIECSSMDTLTDGTVAYSMVSMFVPKPVMSISVKPKDSLMLNSFSKAIGKFSREDPTLRISADPKTKETIMSGMGELHLEIYVERMKREYNVECITGNPSVNYKETIGCRSPFSYTHKKQSGGSGQYAKVIGFIEPLEEELLKKNIEFEFENQVIGTNIPPEFIPSCQKGAKVACEKGVLAGFPLTGKKRILTVDYISNILMLSMINFIDMYDYLLLLCLMYFFCMIDDLLYYLNMYDMITTCDIGVRVVITDGQAHAVDSNDISFQLAMQYGIRQGFIAGRPQILEPIMSLEVASPSEFQGAIIGGLNKRGGLIMATDLNEDGSQINIKADVPLSEMFGYSTDIRSSTQGKGEFSMEYKEHRSVSKDAQERLIKEYQARRVAEEND